MSKKSLFIVISTLLILFIAYRVSSAVITRTLDDANRRGLELYASTVKYAYTDYIYKNGLNLVEVDELKVEVSIKVECEEKRISYNGNVELKGCTVDGSKTKYSYINGKVWKD